MTVPGQRPEKTNACNSMLDSRPLMTQRLSPCCYNPRHETSARKRCAVSRPEAGNHPMHPSGEVGRFQMDNLSSPPGDWYRSPTEAIAQTHAANRSRLWGRFMGFPADASACEQFVWICLAVSVSECWTWTRRYRQPPVDASTTLATGCDRCTQSWVYRNLACG